MISKKLAILKRLTTHLQGITPDWIDLPTPMLGETCPFDMSRSVFRGRSVYGDETKLPFISLLEAPRQLEPLGAGVTRLVQDENWTLLVQGFVKENRDNPLDEAYSLLAWTQMRMARITATAKNGGRGGLYPDEWRLGSLAVEISYQIPIVRPGKDAVSDAAYFYMPISVGTVTELTMPFIEED